MRLVRICVAAVVSSVALAGAAAVPAAAEGYMGSDEARVHAMVNQTRKEKGLRPLVRNDQLVAIARGQAGRMARKGDIYHNPELGAEATRRGLAWERVGENVGMGPSVEVIQQAFLDSPHHYENIVRADYNHLGIGVVKGDDGTMYVTQVFADLTSAPVPALVIAKPAAAKPAPPPPPPATPAAAVAPPAPAARAPAPATALEPKPSIDPNAVIGGYVNEAELPSREQVLAASAGPLERLFDTLAFWA